MKITDEFYPKAATLRAQQPQILYTLPTIDPVRQPVGLGVCVLCLCASVNVQWFVYSVNKVNPTLAWQRDWLHCDKRT